MRVPLVALRIVASTMAFVVLWRSDLLGAFSASLAWMLFVLVERRRVAAEVEGFPDCSSDSTGG
ncbi:MAG: hypothetical protein VKK03_05605 [Synechococcus sp.]|nr:hypothetical protein [Synechococcus sp.]